MEAGTLYHSTDGLNWTAFTSTTLPAAAPIQRSTILLDPSDPAEETLYVIFSQGGLFRSTNDGATWSQVDLNLPLGLGTDEQPTALAIASTGTGFVGTAQGNLFRISAGVATFVDNTDAGTQINSIAVDRSGTTAIVGHADGLVVISTDAGVTTGASLTGSITGLTFAVDGTTSSGSITGSTYAVTGNGGIGSVERSVDFGASFSPVTTDLEASDYFFVAPHPNDGTTIYVLGNGAAAVPPATLPSSGIFKRTFGAP
jgi:hypothetical protein